MFTTDSRTERFLDSLGTKWSYTNEMTFGKLTPGWDKLNLGRSQVKVDGAVQEYGTLMDRGSAAPAPILWCNPDEKHFEVLDGIQRLLAEELRRPVMFSAYVVETTSQAMVKKIRVFSNYRLQGGYQESSEWTLGAAVELLVTTGIMSVEEVAELGGWTPSAVRDKEQVVSFRIAVRGVGGPDELPDTVLRVLAKNSTRADFEAAPTAIAEFTNDIKRMRLSALEAEPYIEEFFTVSRSKGKLYSQFELKLAEFRKDEDVASRLADPSRRRYQPMLPDGKLLRSLKSALTTAERVRDDGDAVEEMEEFFLISNQIKTALQQIERNSARRGRRG